MISSTMVQMIIKQVNKQNSARGIVNSRKFGRDHLQCFARILPSNGQEIIANSFFHESLNNIYLTKEMTYCIKIICTDRTCRCKNITIVSEYHASSHLVVICPAWDKWNWTRLLLRIPCPISRIVCPTWLVTYTILVRRNAVSTQPKLSIVIWRNPERIITC